MIRGLRAVQFGGWLRRGPGRLLGRALGLGGAMLICGNLGCGPSTAHLAIADARVAIEAARGARAETYAIFEFTSAVEHLRKASEEEGYADFDAAVRLAKSARTFADQATQRALGRNNAPSDRPTDLSTATP